MTTISDNDRRLVGFLQKQGPKAVSELAELMKVTETAVRQRLTRLLAMEFISREEVKLSRGRPSHLYSLTSKGRQSAGQNFSDLASVVWEEVRAIEDSTVRSTVVHGIAKRLAKKYQEEIGRLSFDSSDPHVLQKNARSIADFFEGRGIPITVELQPAKQATDQESIDGNNAAINGNTVNGNTVNGDSTNQQPSALLPVLNLHACPYPGLSDKDDLICEMEQAMFSELAGCGVDFHRCDQNSGNSECCSFHLDSHASSESNVDSSQLATAKAE